MIRVDERMPVGSAELSDFAPVMEEFDAQNGQSLSRLYKEAASDPDSYFAKA